MNPFKRTINNGFGDSKSSLPRAGLLLYLGRPNLEAADVPIGDDTEIGDDTIIRWMFLLPADADIRAATGWVSGVGNIFYDAAGEPVAVFASDTAAWSSINQWNVLFRLVDAVTETGRLAIYTVDTPVEILDRAMKVLRAPYPDLPSAFFNGMDFRLATYTGGPTYVPDHLGVLRSPGANRWAVQGMRLDGVTYVNTDESGNPILPSTPQKTVTYNTDWTAKTFAETFDKFDISDPLKAPGWLCEPPRTNKCTCRKANPVDTSGLTKSGDAAAVLSVVDDTAALTAAGLIGLCNSGKVYKIDNSLGVAISDVTISGTTGNLNTHTLSIFCKGGSFRLFGGISAEGYVDIGSSVNYARRIVTIAPGSTTRTVVVRANPGQSVYFILPQLEEGAFCTSPICKAADGSDPPTSLARAATIASFPTAGKIPVNNFAIRMIVVPRASGQPACSIFGMIIADNYIKIYFTPTSAFFRKMVTGTVSELQLVYTHTKDVPITLICVQHSSGMYFSVLPHGGSWISATPLTSTNAKANCVIPANYQIGSYSSSNQFTGNISLFDYVPIPAGITDPMAWAKTHWGVA